MYKKRRRTIYNRVVDILQPYTLDTFTVITFTY